MDGHNKELKKMLDFEADTEPIYREVTDKIVVNSGNIAEVYLKYVPFGIRLHYGKSGRLDGFKVQTNNMEIVS